MEKRPCGTRLPGTVRTGASPKGLGWAAGGAVTGVVVVEASAVSLKAWVEMMVEVDAEALSSKKRPGEAEAGAEAAGAAATVTPVWTAWLAGIEKMPPIGRALLGALSNGATPSGDG